MSFQLYFLGGEQPSWVHQLVDGGVTRVGLSYWSLSRRVNAEKVDVASRFADVEDVLLESGGYQANADPDRMTVGEWEDYAADYESFVERNIDALTLVTELDCPALGPAWVEKRRREFYAKLPPEVFLPVWHPDQGERVLRDLLDEFNRVSVVASVLDDRGSSVGSQLMSAARRHPGMVLHGSALTKPEMVETHPFTSAASSSWISPTRYGDTIVWDGQRMVRYPMKYKDQARVRHQRDFQLGGFDAEAIAAGNNKELTRWTIWCWLQWEQWVRTRRGEHAEPAMSAPESGNSIELSTKPEISDTEQLPVAGPPRERQRELLPVFAVVAADDEDSEDKQSKQVTVMGRSVRQCNTCIIGRDCPKYSPGFECGYDMPVAIKTKAQRKAFLDGLNEIQAQRIAFMRLREEVLGGYSDPNLSKEIKLASDLMRTQAEIEDDGDYFEMTLRGKRGGAQGALSKFFGADVGAAAQALPNGGYTREETDLVLESAVR
jgi:hypothetical protein